MMRIVGGVRCVKGTDESQATAKEAEFELLYRDMRHDAAQQVLRRLSTYQPA